MYLATAPRLLLTPHGHPEVARRPPVKSSSPFFRYVLYTRGVRSPRRIHPPLPCALYLALASSLPHPERYVEGTKAKAPGPVDRTVRTQQAPSAQSTAGQRGRWQRVNARTSFNTRKRLGRSGQVYAGTYQCPLSRKSLPCAVKVVQRTTVAKDQREVDVLVKSNKHPNVVDIFDRHDPSTSKTFF